MKCFHVSLFKMDFSMQSSGIRVKIKLKDQDGSEAAAAPVPNGRSHRNGADVVTISDEDDDVIMQVLVQSHE